MGRARVLLPALACLLSLGLGALGVWQLQRLTWKEALIAQVDARLAAPPVAFPSPGQWPAVGKADEYRRVSLSGRWAPEHEARVQATTVLGGGFWVLTPVKLDEGAGWVWVNRGFVPPELRSRPVPPQPAMVTGLLRLSEPGGGPLRRNQPEADRWYSRDVAALSRRQGLDGPVAPAFVDLAAHAAEPRAWPRPGLTVVQFANSHLVYALTWFALAAMVLAAAGYLVWDDGRHHEQRTDDSNH